MYRSEKGEYVPLQTDRNKQDKARQVPRTDRIAADRMLYIYSYLSK